MWFKKKAYISGYNSNTAFDGTDWRTTANLQNWSPSHTLPSAADANKYFYLPALGHYASGQLKYVGLGGYYWSSDAKASNIAYGLLFSSVAVAVDGFDRSLGYRVDGVFE